jgi:chromosome segregation ATPase
MKQQQTGSQDGEGELRNNISTIENRLKYARVDLKRLNGKDAAFKKDIEAIQKSIKERKPKKDKLEKSIRETVN